MTDCPPRGTDRAFERLARLGADPAATLDDPPDTTAELPAAPPARHRHRAPARLRDRIAFGVTAAALAGAAGLGAVMAVTGGDDERPGVESVPPPAVTSEPDDAPSSGRPRWAPPPSLPRTRGVEPPASASPPPSSAPPASPSPSPVRRVHSPAPPATGAADDRQEPPPPPPDSESPPDPSEPPDSPAPSGTPT